MNAPQGFAATASGPDTTATDEIPDFATLAADPEIAPLLNFEPVVRKVKRPDGWTPELQRELIARIASTGTLQSAVWQMGKHATGAEALYKVPGAASFRASWDAAVIMGRRRNGLDSNPPYAGPVPGIQRRALARALPAEPEQLNDNGLPVDEEQMWDLVHNLGARFSRKVVAEREARLAGEIVAADFYLRQITFLEVMLDLTAKRLGWDAAEMLRELRCGEHHVTNIVSTPLADWLDRARRIWWSQEGEPDRPPHPDVRFLQRHSTGDGECSTYVDQHAYGALTTPARGYTKEQWAEMSHEEQRLARARQYERDAAEQMEWEARARAQSEAWRAGVNESTEAKTNDGEADALA